MEDIRLTNKWAESDWRTGGIAGAVIGLVFSLILFILISALTTSSNSFGDGASAKTIGLLGIGMIFVPLALGFQTGTVIGYRNQRMRQYERYELTQNVSPEKNRGNTGMELAKWTLLGPAVGSILGAEFGALFALLIFPGPWFLFGAMSGAGMGIMPGIVIGFGVGVLRAILLNTGGKVLLRRTGYLVAIVATFSVILLLGFLVQPFGSDATGDIFLYVFIIFGALAAFQSSLFLSTVFDTQIPSEVNVNKLFNF